jgi:hypothetical protein
MPQNSSCLAFFHLRLTPVVLRRNSEILKNTNNQSSYKFWTRLSVLIPFC